MVEYYALLALTYLIRVDSAVAVGGGMECGKAGWFRDHVADFQKTTRDEGRGRPLRHVPANWRACRALRCAAIALARLPAGQVTKLDRSLHIKKEFSPFSSAPVRPSRVHSPRSDYLNCEFLRCGCFGDEAKCEPTFNHGGPSARRPATKHKTTLFPLCLTELGNQTTGC